MTLPDLNATLGQSSTLETNPDTGCNATTSMSIEDSEAVSSSKSDFLSPILNNYNLLHINTRCHNSEYNTYM